MKHKIIGRIKRGVGYANIRFESCREILKQHGIAFPPFHLGTLNIELEQEFFTPNWSNIIHIPQDELKRTDPNFVEESWNFISVIEINNNKIKGFIYRTSTNYHGNKVVELITKNLNGIIDLSEGAKIELAVSGKII